MVAGSAISRDKTRIGWTETGHGEPIVLIHGTAADHTRFDAFAPRLADRFRLYLVDRRGRGSSGDGSAYSIEHEYDDIAAVAEAIGGATVFGHSYGGTVALGAATRTDAVARTITYEGWPAVERTFDPGNAPDKIQALLDAGDEDGAVAVMFRDVVGVNEDQLSWMRQQPMWAGRMAAAHTLPRELRAGRSATFSTADLRGIASSILLLIGGQNEQLFRQDAEEMCSVLKDGRIAVLPDQGRMAIDTAPEMLAETVVSFIDSTA